VSELTNSVTKWKTIACVESVPNHEGRFWTFAVKLERYSGTQTAYIGVGLMTTTKVAEYDGSRNQSPCEENFPFYWHMLDEPFEKDDIIVMTGLVCNGTQIVEFFRNGNHVPPTKLYYNRADKGSYLKNPTKDKDGQPLYYHPHCSMVTGETFTIVKVNTLEYKSKYLKAVNETKVREEKEKKEIPFGKPVPKWNWDGDNNDNNNDDNNDDNNTDNNNNDNNNSDKFGGFSW
jgi:hypothetical protein